MTAKDVILARKLGGGGGGTEITDGIVVKARDADGYATEVDFYGTVVEKDQFATYRGIYYDGSSGMMRVEKVNFKNKVTALRDKCFKGAQSLKELPDISNVDCPPVDKYGTIGENCFRKCTSLTGTLVIPDNIGNIEYGMFADCTGITGVITNASKMAYQAFLACTNLKTFYAPKMTSPSTAAYDQQLGNNPALETVQLGSEGYGVNGVSGTIFKGSTNASLQITIYTTGAKADTILANCRNGATAATIILKASEATTYNDVAYAAGEVMITSTVEEATT